MTSQEFIIWMKGFVSAAHEYAPTPKQWDILKDELSKVSDYEDREQLENDFFGTYDTDMGVEPTLDDLQIGPDGAYEATEEWELYQQYRDEFAGYEDVPGYDWFVNELKTNERFKKRYGKSNN